MRQVETEGRFVKNFVCFDETANRRNYDSNHFEKQKRIRNLVTIHYEPK